jgi:predicted TIM-barrel fold metal-dependent hydrolase
MHVGDFPLFDVGLDGDGLAALMAEHGYSGGLVFHPDNRMVMEVVERVPGAYGLFWANPRVPGFLDDALELLEHPRFLGVKMHPLLDGYHPADPTLTPLYRALAERGLPALIHCGHPIFTLPWSIEEGVAPFPDMPVVLGHMGHGNIVYINAAIDIAARRPHVFLETSGMPMHTKIREAVDRVGPDRVLYGSDAPFHHPSVELEKVRVSGLPPDLVERVLGANAVRLFLRDEAPDGRPAATIHAATAEGGSADSGVPSPRTARGAREEH